MQKTNFALLLHPAFLASLLLLLLNDHVWKYEYPNWFTGKLSDVAGLVVLPVFLQAFYPAHVRKILLFTALVFTWWKSPLSEPLILFFNASLSIPVARVVDYTDLFALAVLPLAAWLKPIRYSANGIAQTCFRIIAGGLAFISLCSTSIGYRYGLRYGYRENRTNFYEDFNTEQSKEEIISNLRRKGIALYEDSIVFNPVTNAERLYYRVTHQSDSSVDWKPVPQSKDSTVYLRRNVGSYYVIPTFVLEGDTLRNLEFTIQNRQGRKKQSSVWIESFETARPEIYRELNRKKRKSLEKVFQELFLKP